MRDPNRIDKFCDELKTIWHKVPDWRFGQLMVNFIDRSGGPLAFYMEDEDFMTMLESFIKEITNEN